MENKKKKVRVELRKNRSKPPRGNDLTRSYQENAAKAEDACSGERVRAKGDISRHRTIVQDGDGAAQSGVPGMDAATCLRGRVLRVHGLQSVVETDDGQIFRCAIRRLLKSLATDERNVVTTGDIVWLRPVGLNGPSSGAIGENRTLPPPSLERKGEEGRNLTPQPPSLERKGESGMGGEGFRDDGPLPDREGMIERVEPRRGALTRESRRREHVLVANVDQLVIVMSLVEPDLKPHLIDRYLAAARQGGLKPVLCLNKIDMADPVGLQPLIGAYSQLGVPTLLTSAKTGVGIRRLRELLRGRATVFSGQSGVGKSSLLNGIQPGLALAVKSVSEMTQKGRHTTTYSQLIRLESGGWVVDTPGVRQLALWNTRPEEVEGYFGEFRPFVPLCGFPDCSHTHESGCAVKAAVARRQISDRRYHSYLGMFRGGE